MQQRSLLSCDLQHCSFVSLQGVLLAPLADIGLPRIQAGDWERPGKPARKALRAGLHLVHQLLQHLRVHTARFRTAAS